MKRRRRRIYIVMVVLGLAMVWLSFLFTFELTKAQKQEFAEEQRIEPISSSHQHTEEQMHTAGLSRGDAVKEAGTGFPILLAGLGVVFVVGGAARFRRK